MDEYIRDNHDESMSESDIYDMVGDCVDAAMPIYYDDIARIVFSTNIKFENVAYMSTLITPMDVATEALYIRLVDTFNELAEDFVHELRRERD